MRIFLRGRLSSLPEGAWADDESQREITHNEVKLVCQGAAPLKTGISQSGRVELYTRGRVSKEGWHREWEEWQTKEIEKKSINIMFDKSSISESFFILR